MTRTLSHSLVRLLAGCVVLVVADHFAPRASAGCGDHVKSAGERADAARPMHDMPSPVPCSGPMCSQSQDTPAPAPAPVLDQDERGLLPERLAPTADPSAEGFATQTLRPIAGPVSFILDPPRPCVG